MLLLKLEVIGAGRAARFFRAARNADTTSSRVGTLRGITLRTRRRDIFYGDSYCCSVETSTIAAMAGMTIDGPDRPRTA